MIYDGLARFENYSESFVHEGYFPSFSVIIAALT
jgi:hypothetical protein